METSTETVFLLHMILLYSGATLSEMALKKITKVMDHAVRVGCPVIGPLILVERESKKAFLV